MTAARFEQLVEEALASIPARFREALDNLAIVIEAEPSDELLAELGLAPPDTLLGLYEGIPLTERHTDHSGTAPDRVTLFQRPIERESENEDDLVVAIGETLIHEIGHYFGLDEDTIQAIEERYWRGEGDGEDGGRNDDR